MKRVGREGLLRAPPRCRDCLHHGLYFGLGRVLVHRCPAPADGAQRQEYGQRWRDAPKGSCRPAWRFWPRPRTVARAVAAYRAGVASEDGAPALREAPPDKPPVSPRAVAEPVALRRQGPMPVRPGRGSITHYSPFELAALIRWIESDTLLRTEEELVDEAISTLGFQRRGKNIVDALRSAIRVARPTRSRRMQTKSSLYDPMRSPGRQLPWAVQPRSSCLQ